MVRVLDGSYELSMQDYVMPEVAAVEVMLAYLKDEFLWALPITGRFKKHANVLPVEQSDRRVYRSPTSRWSQVKGITWND